MTRNSYVFDPNITPFKTNDMKSKSLKAAIKLIKKPARPKKLNNTLEQVSLQDASMVLLEVIKSINLSFTIDSNYYKIKLNWMNETFDVSPSELTKTIECIKYIESKKQLF